MELMDKEGLSEELGISVSKVTQMVVNKEIPYVRIGRLVRFLRSDIEEWVHHQRVLNDRFSSTPILK
jgi:excisionase family DNA binding protein